MIQVRISISTAGVIKWHFTSTALAGLFPTKPRVYPSIPLGWGIGWARLWDAQRGLGPWT